MMRALYENKTQFEEKSPKLDVYGLNIDFIKNLIEYIAGLIARKIAF